MAEDKPALITAGPASLIVQPAPNYAATINRLEYDVLMEGSSGGKLARWSDRLFGIAVSALFAIPAFFAGEQNTFGWISLATLALTTASAVLLDRLDGGKAPRASFQQVKGRIERELASGPDSGSQ